MNIFRTPEARFEAWGDYPFQPNYIEYEGVRMHYLDEGDKDAPVMLLVHGMPTSSHLYRFMIPPLVAAGFRCIAPDHIGFGKSDKVLDDRWYSIDKHQLALQHLIETLDLQHITVVVQDWGGPVGLRGPVDMPDRYDRLCILNTWLHHEGFYYPPSMWGWCKMWHKYDYPGERNRPATLWGRITEWLFEKFMRFMVGAGQPIGTVFYTAVHARRGASQKDSPMCRAVEAPFPTDESKAGARRFPLSLPMYNPDGGNAAVQEHCYNTLKKWTKPAHFIFGDNDPNFTPATMAEWADGMVGATMQVIEGGGHFLQETHAKKTVDLLLARIRAE
jgi:haloalkane dehalogenase